MIQTEMRMRFPWIFIVVIRERITFSVFMDGGDGSIEMLLFGSPVVILV